MNYCVYRIKYIYIDIYRYIHIHICICALVELMSQISPGMPPKRSARAKWGTEKGGNLK